VCQQTECCLLDDVKNVVRHTVLRDKNATGPTKKRFKLFPPRRNSEKASKKARFNADKKNRKNNGEAARELHVTLKDIVAQVGSASPDSVHEKMLQIGTVVPLAMANVDAGEHIVYVLMFEYECARLC